MEFLNKLKENEDYVRSLETQIQQKVNDNNSLSKENAMLKAKVEKLEKEIEEIRSQSLNKNKNSSYLHEEALTLSSKIEKIIETYNCLKDSKNKDFEKIDKETLQLEIEELNSRLQSQNAQINELKQFIKLVTNLDNDLRSEIKKHFDDLIKNSNEEKNRLKLLEVESEKESLELKLKEKQEEHVKEIQALKQTISEKDLKYSLLEMDLKECLKIQPN